MKAFLAGIIIGFLLIGAGAAYYFMSGMAPVAVEDKPMPMKNFSPIKRSQARVEKEMPKSIPIVADETAYLAGAEHYDQQHCAMCHGLPNVSKRLWRRVCFPNRRPYSKVMA